MTEDELINKIVSCGFVENYIKQLIGYDQNLADYTQEIYLMVLEQKDRVCNIYNEQGWKKTIAYLSGLIYRQLKSKTSAIYRKYKRPAELELHIIETCNVTE